MLDREDIVKYSDEFGLEKTGTVNGMRKLLRTFITDGNFD